MKRNNFLSVLDYQLKTRWKSLLISGPCVYILLYSITLLAAPFAKEGGAFIRFIADGNLFLIGAGLAFTVNMTFGVIAHVVRAVGSRRAFILFPATKQAKVVGITLYSLLWMILNVVIWMGLMLLSALARGEDMEIMGGNGLDPVTLLTIIASMAAFSMFSLFFALIRQYHGVTNLLLFAGMVVFALFMGRLCWNAVSWLVPAAGGSILSLVQFLFQACLFYALAFLTLSRLAFRED
ncbi:MAG TPA: hypothetical protein ENL15_03925 [Firmicutes bacterium]|nr:hypothetical protein [Bacillota bacterium]